jgi:hypothetical protein
MSREDDRPIGGHMEDDIYVVDDPDVIVRDHEIEILHRKGETAEEYIARCIAVKSPLTEEQREAIRALGRTASE